ncbi:Wadjet anti-phage system protein JetA family protein [Novosphingobium terrae]|uniref:Wadjet anti-phage system protein JetA family protein n=1 Tax=Novosphingobium terrae TaxID=2726189 RepID=UPI00197F93DD|nr:Wadjet anti-phage system protein JetA family protein [Novosphingobium terrae]
MGTLATEDKPLFGSVPPGLFRVFSSGAKHFYADLLTSLAEDPFGQAGEIATRKRVFEAIAEFIDRRGRAEVVSTLQSDGVPLVAGQSYIAVYGRLKETGWLAEYRDRYRRVVDFDPAARLVLHTLLDIQKGRVRSYGGAVLNVLTLLQSVESDPDSKALNVREAAISARGFMNHLRTVAGTMRRVEALIMEQPTAAALVRRFVTDFIEALVVQDYRNLHARESPYRFRGQILETGDKLLDNDEVIGRIAAGWVAGGIAADHGAARQPIIDDLREIVRVFAGIDDHVQDIETTTFRIERRMTNVVRFSDRMATVSTDRILYAMEMLRSSELADHENIEVKARLQLETLPMTAAHLYSLPRRRAEAPESMLALQPPDPALLRYLEAIDAFEDRIAITPERLERYVEAALAGSSQLEASAFPVNNIEDFLLFERLHEAELGPLADRYEIEYGDGRVINQWVERRSFLLRRRETVHG